MSIGIPGLEKCRLCAKCKVYTKHEDDKCADCGTPTDRSIIPIQAAEAFCNKCNERTVHRIVTGSLIVCAACRCSQTRVL